MVTGKAHMLSQSRKKANGGKAPSGSALVQSLATPPVRKGSNKIIACVGCKTAIVDDTRALQCDRCLGDAWKCAECLNLPADVYDHLVADGSCGLKWFCDSCEKKIDKCEDEPKCCGGKLESLITVISKMVDEFAVIKEALKEKTDAVTTNNLETRLHDMRETQQKNETETEKKINQILSTIDTDLQVRLKLLEEKMDKLRFSDERMVAFEGKIAQVNASTQKCDEALKTYIEKAVEVHSNDTAEEMEEKAKCKMNVIIHGIRESASSDAQERQEDDHGVVALLLNHLKCDDVNSTKVIRLGKRPEVHNPENKPRPIKAVIETEQQKNKLLRESKNLWNSKEGEWAGIFIHQDLTFREREERRKLLAEMKLRRAAGETNLVLIGGKIVKRRSPATHITGNVCAPTQTV